MNLAALQGSTYLETIIGRICNFVTRQSQFLLLIFKLFQSKIVDTGSVHKLFNAMFMMWYWKLGQLSGKRDSVVNG